MARAIITHVGDKQAFDKASQEFEKESASEDEKGKEFKLADSQVRARAALSMFVINS